MNPKAKISTLQVQSMAETLNAEPDEPDLEKIR